jgi:enoyl-[acyl-carrier-protein] reductase (NADH)
VLIHDLPRLFLSLVLGRKVTSVLQPISYIQEGANVLLVDVNLAAVEKAASLIKERVPNAKTAVIKADVSKEADVKAAVDLAVKEFGRLDVMVCGRVFFGQLHYYTHASYWL